MVVDIFIDNSDEENTFYTLDKDNNNYRLYVIGNNLPKLSEIIKNKELIEEEISLKKYRVKYNSLVKNIRYIKFFGNEKNDNEYLIRNKDELINYKVVAIENVCDENKEFIKEKYKDFDYYVNPGDQAILKMEDYEAINNYLEELINYIKKLNLSPFEEIILVYDLVKEKIYSLENRNEDKEDSRSIYKILDNDKIVCTGYVSLFNRIMSGLGIINSSIIVSKKGNRLLDRHERTCVYINDDKYNINGIFFLDPTFDSKKFQGDDLYLYRYQYFMKSFNFFRKIDKEQKSECVSLEFLNNRILDEKTIDEAIENVSIGDTSKVVFENNNFNVVNKCSSSRRMLKVFNRLINNQYSDDNEELINCAVNNKSKIIELFNQRIDGLTFLNALTRVRNIEHKCNPDKYPFDIDTIFDNARGYGFKLPIKELTPEERLLCYIFGDATGEEKINNLKDNLKKEYEEINKKDKNKYKELKLYRNNE